MRLPPCTEYLLPMPLLCPWGRKKYFTLAYFQTTWPPDGSNQQGGGGQPLLPVNADESAFEQTEPSDPAGMEILHIVIFLLLFFTSHWMRLCVFVCYILCPLQFILELSVQICYYLYSIIFPIFCIFKPSKPGARRSTNLQAGSAPSSSLSGTLGQPPWVERIAIGFIGFDF